MFMMTFAHHLFRAPELTIKRQAWERTFQMANFSLSRLSGFAGAYFRPGRCGLTVFILLAAVMVAGWGFFSRFAVAQSGKSSENPVYTISNFQVWADARDAVSAKKAALEDGKVVAFAQLVRRLSLMQAGKKAATPGAGQISQMITSLAVRDEKNSNTEYLATLDFQFSEDAVKRYLRGQRVPYLDRQAPVLTVVPVVDQSLLLPAPGTQKPLLSMKDWESSWQTLDLPHGLVPIRLAERLAIVDDAVLAALVRGDQTAREGLLKAYKSQNVVIALAAASQKKGHVRLMLMGRDSIGDVDHKQDYVVSNGDLLQAVDHGAEVAQGLFEARLKILKLRPVFAARKPVEVLPWQTDLQEAPPVTGWQGEARGERVSLHVAFQGLSHWQSIRRRLMDVDGLEELVVEKLSARGADVSCDYPGGAPALLRALRPFGLTMTLRDGGWVLLEG